MGNCCRRESSPLVGSGEDRKHSDEEVENIRHSTDRRQRRRCTENGASSSSSFSSSTTTTCAAMYSSEGGAFREVKIKMTKKELEELVGWLNMADSSFEQVMSRLANVINSQGGDDDDDGGQVVPLRQRSWKPSLQSIPEV